MELSERDDARKRYQTAFTRRGTEKNLTLLKQIIDLRYEQAQLFGQSSYADWALKTHGENPKTVNHFWRMCITWSRLCEQKEVEELRVLKPKV